MLNKKLIKAYKISMGLLLPLAISNVQAEATFVPANCGTESAMQALYNQNPQSVLESERLEQLSVSNNHVMRSTLSQGVSPQLVKSPKYVVPVVFHVYGRTFNGKSITDQKIIDALRQTNEDFQGITSDYNAIIPEFSAIKDTLSIEFRLAQLDPAGRKTTGIIYHPSACGAGNYGDANVAADNWDNYKYMNVYIQNDLYCDGVTNNSGVAWYPDTTMSNAGIARVAYNGAYVGSVNTSENFRSVLTHEFGHYLNLIHTFDGGCSAANESRCASTGDQICDTPQVDHSSLGSARNCRGKVTNWQNFMNYSSQYANFTYDQVSRSTNALNNSSARNSLWTVANLKATGTYTGSVINKAPVASANGPYRAAVNVAIRFDSSGSYDPDGTVASYAWDFGDGTTSALANPNHSYSSAGNYTVSLTVTDNGGLSNTATTSASIGSTVNTPPTANANGPYAAKVNQNVSFSSRGSNDPDGSIVSYSWDFGDRSQRSVQANPSHAYSAAGSYTVVLTVTDNSGASGSTKASVTVTDGSTGGITANPNGPYKGTVGNAIKFSSAGSSSPDGAIVEQEWDFGDGSGSSSANPSYSYSAAGTYEVLLLVIDAIGNEAESMTTVTVTESDTGRNAVPIAVVNGPYSAAVNSAIRFDSTGSYDPDGAISQYRWSFGDGNSSRLENPNHTYTAAGTYAVSLTVTDNLGATTTNTTKATVSGESDGRLPDACSASSPVDGGGVESGTPVCVNSTSENGLVYFYFYVDNASQVSIKTGHGSGDVAVYHQYNGYPTTSQYDQVSNNAGNTESISVGSPATGWHYLTLAGGHRGLTLQVEIR